ncbi:MAG: sodium-dependent transporter [Ruminococcaceae bacterium]|nr:sodium-dependent transporter [Oscillospiraceae bacterium]
MDKQRSSFTGKLGFVLTAAGSAVGLGNIWRFPYLAAKYGGGIFLLVYLILAVTFGFTLMAAEIAIGRKTGLSAVGAFQKLDKRFAWVGYLGAIVPMIITPYYSVIGGWVTKYFFVFASGGAEKAAGKTYFDDYIAETAEPILWFLVFVGLTALIVFFGVDKGIEKVSKVMMPVLVLMTVFIAVYIICMPGAMDGVLYYITPDFSKFSIQTVLAAMGQLFYSMSIAMGILITYGSYMKKDVNLESSVHQIEIFDTGIAFLAGLMIVPSVFVFSGGDEEALGKGAGLMFETLPKVFNSMTGGGIVGAAFFLMVFFAALTSSISLMETVVSFLGDRFGWGRKPACLAVFAFCVLLGLPSSLGYGVLDFIRIGSNTILDMFDFLANSIIMPIVAFMTSIFVGWILKPKALVDEIELTGTFKAKKLFTVIIKYIAPVCIVLILVSSLLDAFGIVTI